MGVGVGVPCSRDDAVDFYALAHLLQAGERRKVGHAEGD
jgi:hypothetical protein